MDNYHSSSEELFSVFLDRNKLIKFEGWCEQNQVSCQAIIARIIDACLSDKANITEFLLTQEDDNLNSDLEKKIQLLIDRSLAPLIERLDKLEKQIDSTSVTTANYPRVKNDNSLPLTPTETITPPQNSAIELVKKTQKIVYLTRHQTWQRLKQTDYIKSAGYDSFLKAKNDELNQYGIFFDAQKRRFYVIEEKDQSN